MRTLVLFGRLRRKEPGAGGVAGYGRGYFARPSQACEARTKHERRRRRSTSCSWARGPWAGFEYNMR
jgi:hypothetical protein